MKNLRLSNTVSGVRFSLTTLVLVSTVLVSACATAPTSSLAQSDGQITLAHSHIGEKYDTVIKRATASYEVEPKCETRKISLKRKRKAFIYDICGFNPEDHHFADAHMAEAVFHFIERELVRIDVRAEGDDALLENVKGDIQAVFADAQAQSVNDKQKSLEWVAKAHIAGVRAGAGASVGNIHVRLLDESLRESAPWLAEE